jgi:diguanylate cyclase (GGDEF)-like protein/PAS domain S-box-containing protein
VTIGRSSDEIFSGVHADQRRYIFFGVALTTVILIVNGFSIRACMFDCNGFLTVSNERYLRMHGLPAASAASGTSVREIVQYSKASGAFPGDVDSYCKELSEALGRGELVRHLTHLNDGRVIASLSQPIGDGGWISIYEDITEQQLAKVRLEQTRKFLDSIVENVPAPIVVKEPEKGTFVLVNHAYEKFIGLPRERLMGKTVYDVFPPKDAELIATYDNEAIKFSERVISAELSVETPTNGSRIVTTTRLVVLDENDKPHFVIAIINDVTEKRKAEARIAYMAHHDPITGLLNRARFAERLEGALACAEQNTHLAVLFIDLDHFKHVNDTLGHLIGDELLRAVADRLRGCIQEIDAVARLGGDEFAIIQSAITRPGDIHALVDRITAAIKTPYELGGFQTVVDVSIGIAQAPADATTSDELMKRADMALYRAKSDGRGTYRFFESEMLARTAVRRALEASLRNSIVNGELELFYQPVVNITEYRVVGLEALLRWRHPERGILSPAEFMGLAVETGLIVPLGEWVIRQACSDAANWPDDIRIAVNLSPAQFRSQSLAQVVINSLATSGIAPSRLELEITEELLLGHNRDNLSMLEQLRKIGVQIVMDDFGIGYSSLNYLRLFPFDKIKIDRSFINEEDDLSLAIVQAVTSLARVLRVPVTAEGIETREQLDFIRAAGCTEFQGYLFSTPKPSAEIVAFLRGSAQMAANAA